MNRINFLKSLVALIASPKLLSEIKTYNPSDYYTDDTKGYRWKRESTYKNNQVYYYEHGEIFRFNPKERFIKIGK